MHVGNGPSRAWGSLTHAPLPAVGFCKGIHVIRGLTEPDRTPPPHLGVIQREGHKYKASHWSVYGPTFRSSDMPPDQFRDAPTISRRLPSSAPTEGLSRWDFGAGGCGWSGGVEGAETWGASRAGNGVDEALPEGRSLPWRSLCNITMASALGPGRSRM